MKKNHKNMFRVLRAALLTVILFAMTASAADYRIGSCAWKGEEGKQIAQWDKTEQPSAFNVGLFKEGGNEACIWHMTEKLTYDFTDEIKRFGTGIYYFQVYPEEGGQQNMVTSSKINVVVKPVSVTNYYFPANTWQMIQNKWYYFNNDASVVTGWQMIGEKWYYLEPAGTRSMPKGALYVSCTTPDGYQVNADGQWTGQPQTQTAVEADAAWYQLESPSCLYVWLPRLDGGSWKFNSSNKNLLDCNSVGDDHNQFLLIFAADAGDGEEVDLTFQSPSETRTIKVRVDNDASITILP